MQVAFDSQWLMHLIIDYVLTLWSCLVSNVAFSIWWQIIKWLDKSYGHDLWLSLYIVYNLLSIMIA